MPESYCSHAQEIASYSSIGRCHIFQAVASDDAHRRILNGLRGEAIVQADLQPKNIAREVERANLASAAIGKNIVASDGSPDDLIDAIRWLALTVNLFVLRIEGLRRSEFGMNSDDAGFRRTIADDADIACHGHERAPFCSW